MALILILRRWRQEDQMFQVILSYITSLRTAWNTRGPVSKQDNGFEKRMNSLEKLEKYEIHNFTFSYEYRNNMDKCGIILFFTPNEVQTFQEGLRNPESK